MRRALVIATAALLLPIGCGADEEIDDGCLEALARERDAAAAASEEELESAASALDLIVADRVTAEERARIKAIADELHASAKDLDDALGRGCM